VGFVLEHLLRRCSGDGLEDLSGSESMTHRAVSCRATVTTLRAWTRPTWTLCVLTRMAPLTDTLATLTPGLWRRGALRTTSSKAGVMRNVRIGSPARSAPARWQMILSRRASRAPLNRSREGRIHRGAIVDFERRQAMASTTYGLPGQKNGLLGYATLRRRFGGIEAAGRRAWLRGPSP
jgi:hypothetical protein